MNIDLTGKVAIVTGASTGIGRVCAMRLQEAGADVISVDIEEPEHNKTKDNTKHHFFQMDVSRETSWIGLMEYCLDHFKRLDIVVNNAGVFGTSDEYGPQDPENINLEAWQRIHEINLNGVMLGCKHGIRAMKVTSHKPEISGSIINMSSRSGLVGIPYGCSYASTKAAIRNHTKSVALYCASKGYKIRCNCLNPAAIHTKLWEDIFRSSAADSQQKLCQSIPLGHMGAPDDVAWATVFLASDNAGFITGAELNIDGGIMAGSSAIPQKLNQDKE